MSKKKPAPEVQPKDPRQIDIEEWLVRDEYTTPAPDMIKITLHKILEETTR